MNEGGGKGKRETEEILNLCINVNTMDVSVRTAVAVSLSGLVGDETRSNSIFPTF